MYVQINFGRNIDNVPMGITQWLAFQQRVVDALFSASNSVPEQIFRATVEIHRGSGHWMDSVAGLVTEESCHVSFFDPAGFDLDYLRRELCSIKVTFNQDAIALITSSELI